MNRETIKSLQGREVMLVPDLNATDEERAQGLDLADYLIAEQTPHGILEQMMQRNPALRQLVELLQLQLVGIEDYQPDESPQKN